ncbi:hypothetical protein SCA03_45330 [Streptomyces cacaoi]|uniref:Uncharacterized protein n=1 Tax=Streptomyces cacaoi TaxID=1898 RepID=A0A4Y3R377_STRCI|nr:hypothetical protein SCA03_45330 [Streptomyces cacaoi]
MDVDELGQTVAFPERGDPRPLVRTPVPAPVPGPALAHVLGPALAPVLTPLLGPAPAPVLVRGPASVRRWVPLPCSRFGPWARSGPCFRLCPRLLAGLLRACAHVRGR